jgi:flagellar motor component MotA
MHFYDSNGHIKIVAADYQQIITVLQQLENNARASGLLSLSNNAVEEGKPDQPPPAKNLASRNSDTMQAVEQNFTERTRLAANLQAAINTTSHRVQHYSVNFIK